MALMDGTKIKRWLSGCTMILGLSYSLFVNAETLLPGVNPKDPYEKFNRVMYRFNDVLDKLLIKPVATVYNAVLPKPVIKSIGNFFSNVDMVPTIANDLLQANFYQATSDTWRLIINTTAGVIGLFDVAGEIGLERNSEDLGLTFAHWGYSNSNYIVLPFLGPSTVRDMLATPINYQFLTVYPSIYPVTARYEIYGLGLLSRRAELLRYENVMEQAALDKYIFMRDAYMQRRAYLIQRNKELGDPYLDKNKE